MLADVLDLLLPRVCTGCGAPGAWWCSACAADVAAVVFPVVPDPCPSGFPPTWAAVRYTGPAREALVRHKEHGVRGIRPVLAHWLAQAIVGAGAAGAPGHNSTGHNSTGHNPTGHIPAGRPLLLTTVPSSPAALRSRGGDVLRAVTLRAVADVTQPVMVRPLLRQRRRPSDQSGLDTAARLANLDGALTVDRRWRSAVAGHPVLIVDDVCTTGATLRESARALREAGATDVRAAVIAATQRRNPRVLGPARGAVADTVR